MLGWVLNTPLIPSRLPLQKPTKICELFNWPQGCITYQFICCVKTTKRSKIWASKTNLSNSSSKYTWVAGREKWKRKFQLLCFLIQFNLIQLHYKWAIQPWILTPDIGQCLVKIQVMSDKSCFTKDTVVRREVKHFFISYQRLKIRKHWVSRVSMV